VIFGKEKGWTVLSSSGIFINGKLPFKFIIKDFFRLILNSEEFNQNFAWLLCYWKGSASRCLNSYSVSEYTSTPIIMISPGGKKETRSGILVTHGLPDQAPSPELKV
jgi:hypothetical protein